MPQLLTRNKWLWIIGAILISLFIFAACDDDDDDNGVAPAGGPLKIGVLTAFTGDLSDFGPAQENAARLAAQEINAAGGVLGQDIEIVTGDTGTDPSQGVTEATRLVEIEGVHAILGALSSGVTLPIAESVTGPSGVVQISSASTSPALTEAADNDFLFRTTISDAAQGIILAQLAAELGLTSVCTMFINNAYGQGLSEIFAENFEAGGGSVSQQVPHESEQTTYASELGTCTGEAPDALAAIAYPESAGVFLREAVEAGDVGTFLFVDGTKSTDMFDDLGWDLFDGARGTAPGSIQVPQGPAFDAAYEAEYGEAPPLPFLREMYDATYLVALAAEKAGSTDPTAIRDALRDVAGAPGEAVSPGTDGFASALSLIAAGTDINYEGAAGPVDLDVNGDVLIGAIETWTVDAANEDLVTNDLFKVDLTTGEVTKIE
ncbi:MAG: ABC transporter substrate-binding protein [Chloroflexi bacterium]|nr:ABC transporter substrate-binding protein [Chloroflexota bacterium]